jgi:Fe-S cluster biogenesis protein NfuA
MLLLNKENIEGGVIMSNTEKVQEALTKIRPVLQRDGGDIEFVEMTDDNVVKVRLQGHCAGCPGAQITLKMIVEQILKESIPELKGVEAVQ